MVAFVVLHLNSQISGQYFLKAVNELCTSIELIDTLKECKSAIHYLNRRGSDIAFRRMETSAIYPKGCYKYTGGIYAYWNTYNSESANKNGQPICKKGEQIELTITNVLNLL